jgi:hypothetical protein
MPLGIGERGCAGICYFSWCSTVTCHSSPCDPTVILQPLSSNSLTSMQVLHGPRVLSHNNKKALMVSPGWPWGPFYLVVSEVHQANQGLDSFKPRLALRCYRSCTTKHRQHLYVPFGPSTWDSNRWLWLHLPTTYVLSPLIVITLTKPLVGLMNAFSSRWGLLHWLYYYADSKI